MATSQMIMEFFKNSDGELVNDYGILQELNFDQNTGEKFEGF